MIRQSLLVALAIAAAACGRQPPDRLIRNPEELIVRPVARDTAQRGERLDPRTREVELELRVVETTTTLFNPADNRLERVRLRSYQSVQSNPDAPLVAPTIRVAPGQSVRLSIDNQLKPEEACDAGNVNDPHCFNTTNMHAHGAWVSPKANGDNVLIAILPGTRFQYQYDFPSDHPSGTFWYHPHRHGSTSIQVGSGMAGALIVQGNRVPTPAATGDVDTLLKHPNGVPFRERILVLQQIAYACRDNAGVIKKKANGTWLCDEEDVGQVDKHLDLFQKPPSVWKNSGRFTTINGRTLEPLSDHATVGQLERWRIIHAGVRATVKIEFRKRVPNPAPVAGADLAGQADWINANCDSAQVPLHWELAADGLTRQQLDPRRTTLLQPGYRSDLLVLFPTAGDYCVIDAEAPANQAVNGFASRQLLTVVTVDAGPAIADPAAHVKQQLRAAAQAFMPPDVRGKIDADLDNGLGLASFVPHRDLLASIPSRSRQIAFAMQEPYTAVGTDGQTPEPYDPKKMHHTLTLDAIEDWVLNSDSGGVHPFHIHVNPFQIVSAVDYQGADLTTDVNSQYYGLKGVWKDTLAVQANVTMTVRTQYQRYSGTFVMHCHILDHEDRGMMQNVCIDNAEGTECGASAGHTPQH
jgi:FtsP/CotA-like multicopper oxidase with cupredoxin domain